MGPGIPGIAFFLLLILFLMFIGVAIVAGLAKLIAVVFKVRVKGRDVGLVIVLFLLSFLISSLFVRGRQDGVIEGFFGESTRYEGAHLFYGLPEIWTRRFVPYNESYTSLFLLPDNYYFIGFFVDFTFWLAVAVVIMYAVRFYSSKRASERLRIYEQNGVSVVNRERCIGCGLCVTGCPNGVAKLQRKLDSQIRQLPVDFAALEQERLHNRGLT